MIQHRVVVFKLFPVNNRLSYSSRLALPPKESLLSALWRPDLQIPKSNNYVSCSRRTLQRYRYQFDLRKSEMNGPTKDFKWFGEGFDGFPRGLPDDCVEYALYIVDANLKQIDIRQKLREVQKSADILTKKLLEGYIWQRDSFKLDFAQAKGMSLGYKRRSRARFNVVTPGLQHLRGSTKFGDSIEDEWLIVYILHQLSREHPEVWIRAVDTDGQFLLIEAANHVPAWLNPEIAKFRVRRIAGVITDHLNLFRYGSIEASFASSLQPNRQRDTQRSSRRPRP